MFQFRRFPLYAYLFSIQWPVFNRPDCSIRISTDRCLLTAPRSFSQLVTSFFGSQCQGIPLALFVVWPLWLSLYKKIVVYYLSTISKKTSLSWITYSLFSCFFVQFSRFSRVPSLVGLSGLEPPTSRLSGVCSNLLSYKPLHFSSVSFILTLVEINGLEPLTPCLQSRCSTSWAIPPYQASISMKISLKTLKIKQRFPSYKLNLTYLLSFSYSLWYLKLISKN